MAWNAHTRPALSSGQPRGGAPLIKEAFVSVLATSPISRYLALLAAAWMIVMTGRLYPQFKDAVRVDGRVTTVDDFIARSCGARIGPDAATCLAAARVEAQRLLRREQRDSILLIVAPVFGYLVLAVPGAYRLWRRGMAES